MASAGAISVDVRANTRPFEGQMRGLGGLANSIMGKLLAGVSIAALGAFAKSCTEVASDLIEVQNVVDVTFRSMSASVDAWAKDAIDSYGLSETMAKQYVGTFGSMAEAFGFTEREAYGMGTALAGLAGDVASFYNLSQDEAYNKLKGVFSGETEALKSLGVVMTQNALDQYALANGFGRTTSAMTEQEKVALRFSFVQSQLANASGDFARTQGSWANQTRILSLRFQQLKAAIGQGLIAALLPVVRVLNAVVQAATNAANAFLRIIEAVTGKSMAQLTGQTVEVSAGVADMGDATAGAADALGDLADAQGAAAGAAGAQDKAQKALNRTLAGFDRINRLTSESTSSASGGSGGSGGGTGAGSVGGLGSAVGGLGSAVDAEASKATEALSKLRLPEGLLQAFERVKEAAAGLASTISEGLRWGYENVLVPLANFTIDTVLPDTLNLVADALGHLDEFLQKVSDPLSRFCELVRDGLMWAWENVLQPLADWTINEALPPVLDAIATSFDILVTCAEKLKPVAEWLWENVVKPLAETVGDAIVGALDLVNKGLEWLLDQVSKADFTDFLDNLDKAREWLGEKLSAALDTAKGAVEGFREKWESVQDRSATLTAEAKEKVAGALAAIVATWDSVKTKAVTLTATVKATLAKAWTKVKAAFDHAKSKMKNAKRTVIAAVKGQINKHWANAKAGFDWAKKNLVNRTKTITANVKGYLVDKWSTIKSAMNWARAGGLVIKTKAATIVANVKGWLHSKWTTIRSAFDWAVYGLFNKSREIYGTVGGIVSSAWSKVKDAFSWASQHMHNISATISLNLQGAMMNVRGAVNNVIGWINNKLNNLYWPSLRVGNATVGGGRIFPYNPVPYLAEGGWVARNTPRLAVIGDNRREGEIVAPESKMQAMADRAATQSGGASELLPVLNAILAAIRAQDTATYLDGAAIARSVVSHVNAQTRTTGRSPILV